MPIGDTPLIQVIDALGWALLHFMWQGALIGFGYAVARHLFRNTAPTLRYCLGLFTMLALLLAPILTFWQQLASQAPVTVSAVAQTAVVVGNDVWSWHQVKASIAAYLPFIVLLWIAGVLALSVRVLWGWNEIRKLRFRDVAPLPLGWPARVERLRRALGIKRDVAVLVSRHVNVPTVMGWLRPVVLLPLSALTGLSTTQLELVIAHEFGHIRRLDYVVNLLQVAVETVLFYHPVVRWVSRCVREDRELCCDDLVLATCGNPIDYAKALTNLETMRSGWLEPVLNATGGSLLDRVERILFGRRRAERASFGPQALLVVLTAAVVTMSAVRHDVAQASSSGYERITIDLPAATLPAFDRDPQPPLKVAMAEPMAAPVLSPAPVEELTRIAPTPQQVIEREVPEAPAADATLTAATDNELQVRVDAEEPMTSEGPALAHLDQAPSPITEPQPARLIRAVTQQPVSEVRPAKPMPERRVAPEYPRRALIRGEEGQVTVAFQIDPNGKVHNAEVVSATGVRLFKSAALEAIADWTFDPSTVTRENGMRATQTFNFSLQSGPSVGADEERCQRVTGSRICHPGAQALSYYKKS